MFNSVTFGYDDMNEWFDVALGKKKGHIYSRNTNPTVRPLEEVCFPNYVLLEESDQGKSVRRFGAVVARLVRKALRG